MAHVRRAWLVLFGTWALLGACTKKPEASSAGSAAPGPVPLATPAPSAMRPADASPGVAKELAITNLVPGEMELEATRDVRLEVAAAVERKLADGNWAAIPNLDLGAGYRLVEQCEPGALPPPAPDVGACVELDAGKTFHPVPFEGLSCSAQCNHICRANGWEGPGTFRFVVRECGSAAAFAGPPFELPDYQLIRGLPRWGVATDVASASVVRLELSSAGSGADAAPSADQLAGFAVRPGGERPVDATALASLLGLLRSAKGFDDDIMKRCAMKHLVGFRLTRRPATTGIPREDVAELALDFNCQKLFLVRGGSHGQPRRDHATHFDPSRQEFLALVKLVLPNDSELAKLR